MQDLGLPPLNMAVLSCLYLSWFAQRSALPFLLLGVAIGRTLVDEATLPVHILVIGIPVALLLPLRSLFVAQRWLWQAVAAALLAVAVPKLAALLLPPLLTVLRFLPPFAGFTEPDGLDKVPQ